MQITLISRPSLQLTFEKNSLPTTPPEIRFLHSLFQHRISSKTEKALCCCGKISPWRILRCICKTGVVCSSGDTDQSRHNGSLTINRHCSRLPALCISLCCHLHWQSINLMPGGLFCSSAEPIMGHFEFREMHHNCQLPKESPLPWCPPGPQASESVCLFVLYVQCVVWC